jgi:hypothetical protein
MVDLAALSLTIENARAIADAKATGAALDEMGAKGEGAALKLVRSSSPVEAAIRRQAETAQFLAKTQAEAIAINDRLGTSHVRLARYMASAATEQRKMTLLQIEAIAMNERLAASNTTVATSTVASTHGMGIWSALQAEAAGHVGGHSLAIGRLERNLASVTERALGLNSTMGLLGSSLLKFGVGTIETVGILAGIAAITAAWEYFTGAARKALEENEKLRTSLETGNFREALGPAPDLRLETDAQRNQLTQDKEYRRQLIAFGTDPNSDKIRQLNVTIAHEADVLAGGEARLTKARMDASTPLEKITVNARNFAEEARKAQEDFLRYQQLVRSTSFSPESLGEAVRGPRATWTAGRTLSMGPAESNALQAQAMSGLLPEAMTRLPESLLKLTVAFDAATRVYIDLATRLKLGKESLANELAAWGYSRDSKGHSHFRGAAIGEGIEAGATSGAAAALAQFTPEALTYRAVTTGINYIVSGFADMATSMLDGGAGAREYARALRQQTAEYAAAIAQFKHDDLAATLAQNSATAEQLIKQMEDLYGNVSAIIKAFQNGTLVNPQARIDDITAQAAKNAAIAQRQAGYSLEDLQVRNLRATGQGDAAGLIAYREQQARELANARDTHPVNQTGEDPMTTLANQLYLNTLQTTLNSELLAYQNGLLSTALRNAPTGFFASAYYGEFATPRSSPASPAPNPVGPNPTGGLTPPGGQPAGRPHVTVNVASIAVNGNRSGDEMVKELVTGLKKIAGTTGGPHAPLSATLDLM